MTIAQLKTLHTRYNNLVADTYRTILRKRKLGFTFDGAFTQHPQIIQSIVLDAILEINQQQSTTDQVIIPVWLDEISFKAFISKISVACA